MCAAFAAALAEYGVPEQVLTDNGKQFTGKYGRPRPAEVLFDRICRKNGIEHLLTKSGPDHDRQDRALAPDASSGNCSTSSRPVRRRWPRRRPWSTRGGTSTTPPARTSRCDMASPADRFRPGPRPNGPAAGVAAGRPDPASPAPITGAGAAAAAQPCIRPGDRRPPASAGSGRLRRGRGGPGGAGLGNLRSPGSSSGSARTGPGNWSPCGSTPPPCTSPWPAGTSRRVPSRLSARGPGPAPRRRCPPRRAVAAVLRRCRLARRRSPRRRDSRRSELSLMTAAVTDCPGHCPSARRDAWLSTYSGRERPSAGISGRVSLRMSRQSLRPECLRLPPWPPTAVARGDACRCVDHGDAVVAVSGGVAGRPPPDRRRHRAHHRRRPGRDTGLTQLAA